MMKMETSNKNMRIRSKKPWIDVLKEVEGYKSNA